MALLPERMAADGYWKNLGSVDSGAAVDSGVAEFRDISSRAQLISALGICVPTEIARRVDGVYGTLKGGHPVAASIPSGKLAAHNGEADCLLKIVEECRVSLKEAGGHAGLFDPFEVFDKTARSMEKDLLYNDKTRAKALVSLPDERAVIVSRSVGYFQAGNDCNLLVGKGSYWMGRGLDDRNAVILRQPVIVGTVRRCATSAETTERRVILAQLIAPSGLRRISRIPKRVSGFVPSSASI